MKRFNRISFFLLCGILLTFAAFPVFAQDDKVQEVRINKQPLQDLGAFVLDKIDKGEVDLTQPFKVVAEIVLTSDGRIDTSVDKETKKPKSKFVLTEGDEQMTQVAKTAVEAFGNSGFLGYLRNLGAEKLKITFVQDKDKVFGIIESEQATAERAKTMASKFNTLFSAAKYFTKLSEDEKTLLSGFQPVTTNEKVFILSFELPVKTVQDLLRRNLKKAAQAETWKGGE